MKRAAAVPQAYLDQTWQQLCANVPEVVLATLQAAFEDNEAPSAALDVDGDEISLALLVPCFEEVVPVATSVMSRREESRARTTLSR